MQIHHRNYLKLARLLPDLDPLRAGDSLRLEAKGLTALKVEVLERQGNRLRFALAYHLEVQGAPQMELRVDLDARTVEAVPHQSAPCTDRVDPQPGQTPAERSLNDFLSLWLSNLHAHGYTVDR